MVLVTARPPNPATQQEIHLKKQDPDAMVMVSGTYSGHFSMRHPKPRDPRITSPGSKEGEDIVEFFTPESIERRKNARSGPPWLTDEGFVVVERRSGAQDRRRRWH